MQIRNPGDRGWGVLRRGEEGSNIVMEPCPDQYAGGNIKAGAAYLLARLAKTEFKSPRSDTDKAQCEYTVFPGTI